MAFIPDDALDRFDEIAPASQLGYQQICRYRNHGTGICPKPIDEIIEICAAKYKWSRATKFNVKKQLKDLHWIEITPAGVRPLVGDFSPVSEKPKSKKLDFEQDQSNFLDLQLPVQENQSNFLDSDTNPEEPQSENLDSETETDTIQSKKLDFEAINGEKEPEKSNFLDSESPASLKKYTNQSKNLDSPPYNPHKEYLNYNQPLNQLLNCPPFSDFSEPSAFLKLDLTDLLEYDSVARIFKDNALVCEEARKPSHGKKKIPPISFKEFRQFYEIYEFWKIVCGKNANTRITAQRIRAVVDRLRAHNPFTLEELKSAVIGCRASPNHNGTNADTIYNDLELICRTDQQVEKMIGYFDAAVTLKNGGKDVKANAKPERNTAPQRNSGRTETELGGSEDVRSRLRAPKPPARV